MPDHLYALYVQATRDRGDGSSSRAQWMVIPPAPQDRADRASLPGAGGEFVLAHRVQTRMEDRTTWKFTKYDADTFDMTFVNLTRSLEGSTEDLPPAQQWQFQPLLTAQISVDEVLDMHRKPRTPWPLIQRFTRVAKKRHGFSI
jgi:hypothetical protein